MATQRFDSLTWSRAEDKFRLQGVIDEHSDLQRLAAEVPRSGAVLDLGGVKRINSVGVRLWIEFVKALRGVSLVLESFPPVFVSQANIIANFVGEAVVRSVDASFECLDCSTMKTVLVQIDAARSAPHAFNAPACGTCGKPMELSDTPESYFQFVRLMRPRSTA